MRTTVEVSEQEWETAGGGHGGKASAKENIGQATASRTQSRISELSDLTGVRKVARREKRTRFTALLHHVTTELLRDSYYALKRDAAPGVDGVTSQSYRRIWMRSWRTCIATSIAGRIERSLPREPTYQSGGRQRPLGIAALEDKIVQHAVVTVLNQIYEEDFLGLSLGGLSSSYRNGKGRVSSQAIRAAYTEEDYSN